MIDLSCKDWQDRIRNGRSLVPHIPLQADEARRGVAIFNRLRLPDVVGQPAMVDAAGDWFREIVAALFGAFDDAGARLVREMFLLVPKKNSKTTNGAALMLTALLINKRPRAEFLLVGPTQEVARLAYSQVVGMIEADPEGFLQKRMHVRDHLKEIIDRRTKATLHIKTFDAAVITGVKPAGVLLDELHEIARDPAASRIIGQLRGGMMPTPEAFLVFITTQSDIPPTGVFRDELRKARSIRDGTAPGVMLPVLYEFPNAIAEPGAPGRDPAWYDPSLWWMVTPNRDRSVTIPRLVEEFETARRTGQHEIVRWASQHLNIEIGLALKSDRWRGADHWANAFEPGLTLDTLLERCEVVCIGIDGGGLDDLLGLAIIGREAETRRWLHWSRAWVDSRVLETRRSEAQTFLDMAETGDLVIVDDIVLGFAEIAEIAARCDEAGLLSSVGLDPMGVGMIVDALAEKGIEGDDRVKGISQGWTLNGAIKTAEVKLANRTLVHCGQALMSYAVGNARVEPRGNAITITKQASGTAKIDPLMATFDAVALMSKNPVAAGQSIWNDIAKWESSAARQPDLLRESESIRV
jgi:phage terminase large subunit-like protein